MDEINPNFDFRDDAGGRDPDSHSATLRRYHQLLWSKPLPDGRRFDLVDTKRGHYLYHLSELGEHSLSSDSITHSYTHTWPMRLIIEQIPEEEREDFIRAGSTIGATVVFPGNRVDNKLTLNQARGMHPRIRDRFDLTLECIRRHYADAPSPLTEVLARYADFFSLFGDFRGYVEFFLLQDLVSTDGTAVAFLLPFDGFGPPFDELGTPAYPADLEAYKDYRRRSLDFIKARNRRIVGSRRG